MIRLENITKSFGQLRILDNISLLIEKGKIVSITGASGAGKSTLLQIMGSLDKADSGKLFINNQNVMDLSGNKLANFRNAEIGFVFQFHYLLPEFTCLKNIMIPALKLGKYTPKEIEERAYQKLEILGLRDQALKPASKLSGGQQQRVAIARALINDPLMIMCDEPTGNLDSKNTAIVFEIFKELTSQQGQTIIAVTHDEEFARSSDRIIEMRDGEVV